MGKKQYMEILLSQIRNKKARDLVSEEIEAHIDDQAEAYRQKGMKDRDAEYKAVCEMGDPVETGVSLDRIHKPRMSWEMIILIGIINAVGLAVLSQITSDINLFQHQVWYTIAGIAVMILICMLDYTWIERWCGILSICFLGSCIYAALFEGAIGGTSCFLMLPGGISVSMNIFVYLSLPLFAALLYKYRKKKWYDMLIPAAFMAAIIFIFSTCVYSISITINLILLSAVLLTFAVAKGWYPVKKKIFLGVLWGCLLGFPCLSILYGMKTETFAAYQIERMNRFLDGNYVVWSDKQLTAQTLLSNSQWIGQSLEGRIFPGDSMAFACDYMVLHVMTYYGILALLAVIGLFAFLCFKMFRVSLRQKNQFGMIMGLSCSFVLGIQILEYIMMNLGFLPPTTAFLPLFSYGGSGTIISYLLLGILMSIYRYQNLVKERPLKRTKFRFRIERLQE